MKKLFFIFILLLSCLPLCARVGCMDNSWHVQRCTKDCDYKMGDSKTYHYVKCNCPCRYTVQPLNQCIRCRHYHEDVTWQLWPKNTVTPPLIDDVSKKQLDAFMRRYLAPRNKAFKNPLLFRGRTS